MSSNNRVVKFRRRRNINIGIVIFVILFLYIVINIYIYFTKEHMSIYEVQEGSNVEDNLITGLILRDENIINTDKAGYISYLQKEGARVAKNNPVYSVDDSRQILELLTGNDEVFTSDAEANAQFKYEIKKFRSKFSDSEFLPVYTFKEDAKNAVIDLMNQAMIEKGQQIQEETGLANSYEVVPSPESGIVTYYLDSLENINVDMVNSTMFDEEIYQRTSLRTTEMLSISSPVYKLVTSETWSIILPISVGQYEKLLGKEQINFTIQKDDFDITADLMLLQKGSEYYAQLTMDKYLTNYLQDRYLEIILHIDAEKGLKIPLSALVEKDFYLVPLDYFTLGGDSNKDGLTKESYSENGEAKLLFVPTDKYYEDDVYGYVDARLFTPGTWIVSTKGNDRYQLNQTGRLTGVFNVNMGYAVFKRIEILYQNKAYCIVGKNTSYGLSLYDHIALDGSTAVEQAIIY